jgi:hypothetical protein
MSPLFMKKSRSREEGSAEDVVVDLASPENLQSINEEYLQGSTFQLLEGGLAMQAPMAVDVEGASTVRNRSLTLKLKRSTSPTLRPALENLSSWMQTGCLRSITSFLEVRVMMAGEKR